ncbi:HAMP domain-containing protein [Aggregicoccus sp. 17bor-14]|uniref:sensor histidine kinase n=1 Tax=Myxococcaceae TaxID=31 RepID=UPI00129D20D2|nr:MULTISPECIES: ATP-binding protein [Myxococcaceae]MBF5042029.1 HAMP domain-containing protein [Simulacricoccus sp. 17bor-14]MRI87809.1 HAMP domain-containing protein [Aggregicoccus sp. 17bor-14]
MSFRLKLLLVLVVTGVGPVLLLGLFTFFANRDHLRETAGRLQLQAAVDIARSTGRDVLRGVDDLRASGDYLGLERLQPEQVGSVLAIPYRQLRAVSALAVLDGRGNAVAPAVYTPVERPVPGRTAMDAGALEAFSSHVPFTAAMASRAAVGPPYAPPGAADARVALAVRLGTDGEAPARLLVAELALQQLGERLREAAGSGGRALLVDASGAPVTRVTAGASGEGALSEGELALVRVGLRDQAPAMRAVQDAAGREWLAAFAPVPDLGWGVLVTRSAEVAYGPAQSVRRYTLFGTALALLAAAALGLVLAREVSAPLARLAGAVEALGEGRYDTPVPVTSSDEVGQLGRALAHMAQEVRRRDGEIRTWGEQLQQRVDEKTRELQEAHAQVARSRHLAGLGSLAAGVAHELNNPLTGVIGLAGLLRREVKGPPGEKMISALLEQAQRIATIARRVREMVDQERQGAGVRFSLLQPVRAALEELQPALDARPNVSLVLELPEEQTGDVGEDALEVEGHPESLKQLVTHLVQNALTAMQERGGQLTVGCGAGAPGALRLWVADTGCGIPERLRERIFDPFFTTKAESNRLGLGLSLCHQIVDAHHGRIRVESTEGVGSTFTVLLPQAAEGAHLQ